MVNGQALGALCVLDTVPRPWSERGLRTLAELAAVATAELELRVADVANRRALAERDERFRLVAQVSHSMIYDRDLRAGTLYRSEALLTTFGYDPATTPSDEAWWLARITEEDRPQVVDTLRRAHAGEFAEWSLEYCFRRADGSVATVLERGAALHGDDGTPVRLVGAITDVSERARTVVALRESERRFRGILETLRVPALTLDTEACVTFANDAFLELVGEPRETVLGRDFFGTWAPAPEAERRPERAALRGGAVAPHTEQALVTRAGERRLVAWDTTLLRDPGGVVVGAASIGHDVTERRRLEERLRHQAFHDPLTGLANRALFLDRLGHALDRGARDGHAVAVLFLDLDDFKAVNDSLGHAAGDALLLATAERLRATVRAADTVARFGGDEFAVLVEDAGPALDATALAERILAAFRPPFAIAGREVVTTASIGITLGGAGGRAEELLRDADVAMYAAKSRGRGQFALYEPTMHDAVLARVALETRLRRALDGDAADVTARGELRLEYQPIVSLPTGAVTGVEALARWRTPDGAGIPPAAFIPVAEATGLVVPLGRWVLRTACCEAVAWRGAPSPDGDGARGRGGTAPDAGRDRPTPTLSVNVSGRQLAEPSFVADVWAALTDAGLPSTALMLEITESVLVQPDPAVAERLADLREMGVAIAIDDFGTGYSSLASLQHVPADVLKVDRAFVRSLGSNGRDTALVEAVVALGGALGLRVVAEGVETAAQAEKLRAIGCSLAQGFHFARPLATHDVPSALATRFG